MNEKLRSIILLFISIILLSTNVNVNNANAETGLQMTNNKNYNIESKSYKMDFSLTSLGQYKSVGGWKFSNEANSSIKDGKLYCANGKAFDIRSEFILGDVYGLSEDAITFDMVLEKGTVSVGIRLVSTVSQNDTGVWFHLTKDKVRITIGGTAFDQSFSHNLDLATEQKYKITGNDNQARLFIGNTLIANVELNADNVFTAKDASGNVLGEPTTNVRTPNSGFWKMSVNSLSGYIDNAEYSSSVITQTALPQRDQRVVDYSTWVATDDLDRVTPMQDEAGKARKDKYVGLFYFLTGDNYREGTLFDVTKEYITGGLQHIKEKLPKVPGIYWAEPYFGYYLNTDTWVYRKHINMFEAADIDFLFLDVSNGDVFSGALPIMLDTMVQIRKEGGQTPEIAFMCGDMPHILVKDLRTIYDLIYTKPEYKELFFMWEGKPLILGNNDVPGGDRWTVSEETIGEYPESRFWDSLSEEDKAYFNSGEYQKELSEFTVRKSWAWQARKYDPKTEKKVYAGYWDYLDKYPQGRGTNFKGELEQMPVGMALLANLSVGRSYVKEGANYGNGKEDFEFTLGTAKYGYYFAEQFDEALKVDPKVVMITGWNEWNAGRQSNPGAGTKTGNTTTPYYHYTDQLNPEFSRDGEPMKVRDGVGFGDNYYYQMVSYIRKYKGMNDLPGSPWINAVSFDQTISEGEGRFSDVDSKIMNQWETVKTQYMDNIGDTQFRYHDAYGLITKYINTSGRNDFDYAKVTQDDKYMYFLAKTLNGIITADSGNWMNLYINSDQKNETGWEGYDYIINRSRDGKTVSVEKFVNNAWEFESVGSAEYLMGTNNITIRIEKSLLGIEGNEPNFDFKWSDNSTTTGNVMQFMDLGDSAPNDRFDYRFSTKGVIVVGNKDNKPGEQKNNILPIIMVAAAVAAVAAVIVILVVKNKKKS